MGLITTLAAGVAAISALPSAVQACDTPVYRFAMYNWKYLAVYRVYYMHHGQPDEADAAANSAIEALADERPAQANVTLIPINVDDETELEGLPRQVLKAWNATANKEEPTHLVFTPRGTLLHAGRLDEAEVGAMADSPARTELAKLLEAGHAGVLLVLSGTLADEYESAVTVVNGVVQRGKSGQIRAATLVPASADDEVDGEAVLDVGTLSVKRDDPAERWLVRALLQTESDLADDERAMVFPIYGRGRAMEPYIGLGISVDNLSDAIGFLSGACSCEVKEQNPGMDLPTHWDWEAAALAVAERYGAEEGNEDLLGQENLFPTILIAADDTSDGISDRTGDADDTTDAPAKDQDLADDEPGAGATTDVAAGDDSQPAADAQPEVNGTPRQDISTAADVDDSFGSALSRNMGVIAAIGCVVLVLSGFFLMRPRG